MKNMLTFDPTKRLTIDEALSHPYLAELHFPEDEPSCEPLPKNEFEFEEHDMTMA